ncbi:GNAT family N-acetyltransferase [Aneurinibacillus thermoaerophilus]|jgi:acetoin utilization protein AcuA|uniref:Acetoin utilization protein AcuA n=1 Tax=Aneurinibacillus thermoaerophilus TaxID=143495 RepID=A0A1G8D472_ANETH|nr:MULTISPECIES: GNAT family N-acetyltransferase [Aneurinibacillus]AMA74263.1 hypothetical protein ACH33_16580 [Aneurinibacillus sp. XH2]MED0675742.1 GNAT family N-acetyltransferase [Aneurinibacillus thermoaerophilus]MED0758878.1 GNAT family N-acetyltransferase [Aneurinibacillus thermoaerophilus]MED0761502.1 GNAT family N-acetyltransferase [Aneurinibacillus thermoaerophilus]SDH52189.1 acetoin utilization protein AcuA [Aneurinibacillus thermoaerophilus]
MRNDYEGITFISVFSAQQLIYPFHSGLACFREPGEQCSYLRGVLEETAMQISAAVHHNQIVGYATLLPPDSEERWKALPYIRMMGALEVAPSYRRQKIARRILQRLFADARDIENQIVLALEYYWHWDLKNSGVDVYEYKRMLKRLLASAGMEEVYTDDPDIQAHAANFAMARIGRNILAEQMQEFFYLANPRVW